MYQNKKILALIPARGGSKGLPHKNTLKLCGKPVIAWTIDQARHSRHLDCIIVSTDSPLVAKVAKKYGAEVPFMRPEELAGDEARSIDVVLHAINFLKSQGEEYDYLVLLEPTSPLRETNDIDLAIEKLLNNSSGALSLVSVCRAEAAHPAFDVTVDEAGFLVPYEDKFFKIQRRQEISDVYFFEGTIYIASVPSLLEGKGFFHEKTIPYIVPRWKSPELDELLDFVTIEAILKNKKKMTRKAI